MEESSFYHSCLILNPASENSASLLSAPHLASAVQTGPRILYIGGKLSQLILIDTPLAILLHSRHLIRTGQDNIAFTTSTLSSGRTTVIEHVTVRS